MKLYHATPTKFLPRILHEGLTVPRSRFTSGSRKYPAIYLYRNYVDAINQFNDIYEAGHLPYRVESTVLEVNLPTGFRTYKDPEWQEGSVVVDKDIPAKYIKVLKVGRY